MYCTFDINRHNFEVVEGQKFGLCMLLHLPDDPVRDRPEIPARMEAGGSSRVAAGVSRSGVACGDSGSDGFGRSGESLENSDRPPLAGL